MNRLVSYSWTMTMPLSVDLAQTVLADYLLGRPLPAVVRKGIPLDAIVSATAKHYGLNARDLRSERRDRPATLARQTAMFLARRMTDRSLTQIGQAMGQRDHATVQRAVARIQALVERDPAVRTAVEEVVEMLGR